MACGNKKRSEKRQCKAHVRTSGVGLEVGEVETRKKVLDIRFPHSRASVGVAKDNRGVQCTDHLLGLTYLCSRFHGRKKTEMDKDPNSHQCRMCSQHPLPQSADEPHSSPHRSSKLHRIFQLTAASSHGILLSSSPASLATPAEPHPVNISSSSSPSSSCSSLPLVCLDTGS